jgi:hypothetical protein
MERYLMAIDTTATDIEAVQKELKKMKITIAEIFDFINTIVIEANEKQVLKIKKQIKGIISIDIEGQMSAI